MIFPSSSTKLNSGVAGLPGVAGELGLEDRFFFPMLDFKRRDGVVVLPLRVGLPLPDCG